MDIFNDIVTIGIYEQKFKKIIQWNVLEIYPMPSSKGIRIQRSLLLWIFAQTLFLDNTLEILLKISGITLWYTTRIVALYEEKIKDFIRIHCGNCSIDVPHLKGRLHGRN
jgi:hypothetical protein